MSPCMKLESGECQALYGYDAKVSKLKEYACVYVARLCAPLCQTLVCRELYTVHVECSLPRHRTELSIVGIE
jgi:hypothetical protein